MIKKENIPSVIPQRAPFVMIDELLQVDESSTRSSFMVIEENILVDAGELSEAGVLENIAQTAAARAGYIAISENKPVAVGYIGAVNGFEIFRLPKVKDQLETVIEVINQVFSATIITGRIMCNGDTLAQCEMKIFINNNLIES
jgi:predicted hotdog family 3-hydroxylacyl-ACP dehydratase